jgi:hypothetical protein
MQLTEGTSYAPWSVAADPARRAARAAAIEAAAARCRALAAPKLSERVHSLDVGGEATEAVAFHTLHPFLCAADSRGYLHVCHFPDGVQSSAFHVATGGAVGAPGPAPRPAHVTLLRQLNEAESNLLLAGTSDGAVRVWRTYALQGSQRLATALQAVPITIPPTPMEHAAAFAWLPALASLVAAGGASPSVLHRWDLVAEKCVQTLLLPHAGGGGGGGSGGGSSSGGGGGGGPKSPSLGVLRLEASGVSPDALLAAASDGTLRLYDVRTNAPPVLLYAAPPRAGKLVGAALEANGRAGAALAGYSGGDIAVLDIRGGSGGR